MKNMNEKEPQKNSVESSMTQEVPTASIPSKKEFYGMAEKMFLSPEQQELMANLRARKINNKMKPGYNSIVLHIPHSSRVFPKGCGVGFDDLTDEEKRLIDYFTDELFLPKVPDERIGSIVCPYCRLYCDVERLANDPLEKNGLGICYRSGGRCFSNGVDALSFYVDYQADGAKKILSAVGPTLLIDCHSFSRVPTLLNSDALDVDICIGFNADDSRPGDDVIDGVVSYFRSCGYKVGVNSPFPNSKTFLVPVKRYHSLMIEVNKRLYMHEITETKIAGFERLQKEITGLYDELLG